MRLIIDISEYNVEYIKNAYGIPQDINMIIAEAIINGKQIPTPHGRLIDADALKETLDYYIREANWGDEVNKGLRWVKDEFINSENTVIEAEGSENHDD